VSRPRQGAMRALARPESPVLRTIGRGLGVVVFYGAVTAASWALGGTTGLILAFVFMLVLESRLARFRSLTPPRGGDVAASSTIRNAHAHGFPTGRSPLQVGPLHEGSPATQPLSARRLP